MGLSTSLIPAHDDALHSGNAKRAVASGVASLDAASKVVQEPASKGAASGIATLDAASKVVQEPASKAVASGLASLDASSNVVQEPASKGAASGIATLDASSRVPAAQLALAELLSNKNAASGYAGLDASVLLALAQQRLNFKVGIFTYDTSIATGTLAITGVGFTPRLLVIFGAASAAVGEMSIGLSNGTNHYCIWDGYNNVANTWFANSSKCIYLMQVGGSSAIGVINSLDSDGFTIGWTKSGAKTGTGTIFYIAIR